MAKEELIQLVELILDVEKYSEEQINSILELLNRNESNTSEDLSPEDITDQILNNKPIQL